MTIYRSTLIAAIRLAVEAGIEDEKARGYFADSAMLATWRELLKELESGGSINIKESGS